MNKALFLDRDGVINQVVKNSEGEYDSPQNIDEVSLVSGIEKLIGWANEIGIKVVEVSNQPGVAKGKMSMEKSEQIENKVSKLLEEKDVWIDKKYICYHHPRGVVPEYSLECDCRKPKPGLLMKAAKEMGIDLRSSVIVGDRDWDVIAGKAAGCKTILYLFKEDSLEKIKYAMDSPADYKSWSSDEILEIVKDILFKK